MCGMRGHVAPASTVSQIRPQDAKLAVSSGGDGRLCRCVRCDTWVDYEEPEPGLVSSETIPPENELPRPLQGRALNERITVRGIAVLRALNALMFALVSVLLLVLLLGLPEIQTFASTQLQQLQDLISQYRPTDSLVSVWEQRIADLQRWQFAVLLVLAVGYTVLQAVEAVYLWQGKRWAEYLTAIESMVFLPYLGYNVFRDPAPLHLGSLALESAIVIYLVFAKRLFGVRGGDRRLQELFSQEMDWPRIYSEPPLRRPPSQAQVRRSLRP